MDKIRSADLLDELQATVRTLLVTATRWQQEPVERLTAAPQAGAWSVIQVLAHLNFYSRYYHAAISKCMEHRVTGAEWFSPGWLGNYFTRLMEPKEDGGLRRKMKAPANSQPVMKPDAVPTILEFLQHQQELLQLLEKARIYDLNRLRVPTSLTPLIRLKLGDTFRFLIAHQRRHWLQAERTLQAVGVVAEK